MSGAFSIVKDNPVIAGCTVSRELMPDVLCFSLAKGTDISPENYPSDIIHIMLEGSADVIISPEALTVRKGECIIKPSGLNTGTKAHTDTIYLEASGKEQLHMNEAVKAGEVFTLADLVPYQPGRVVNMDVASSSTMKFAVMSFDEGTGLSEHAAPGEALIFALDGEGIIGYEGKEYTLKAGGNFKFAKNGRHYVKAVQKFKMALLLVLS